MITEKSTIKTEAVFSDDKQYRYLLKKEFDAKKPKAAVIMLNPSISSMITTDHTTMFILNNLAKFDFGSFDILNILPTISKKINLEDSEEIPSEILDENIKHIKKSAEGAEKVLIAWGSISGKIVQCLKNDVLEALTPFEDKLYTISNKLNGKPYHPLCPQIRNDWIFNKFELKKHDKKEEKEVKADVENRDAETV